VVTPNDGERLAEIAARLDRLRNVPTDVLAEIVTWHGLCMWASIDPDQADTLTGADTPDRELAARYCAGCPVQDECLEWELRIHGADTVGVWGAMPEDDRRALYPLWRARGDRPGERTEGGESP
jgi:WhiB family transcriptional regulator, redox-sensing transcriptional regulator